MYIIRTPNFTGSFDGVVYETQSEANEKAKKLVEWYKADMYVCKVVDISLFKAPLMESVVEPFGKCERC